VIISHDRYFLNRVVDRIAELELGRFALSVGDYDDYQAQKLARQEQIEAAQRTQVEQIEKMERFIRKFRYTATKARQVQSRIKMLDRMERVEVIRAPKRIHFRFPQPPRSGTSVCELRKIRKAYGDNVVYAGVDFRLLRGDRVALVGINGAGKSTLLKMVAGVLPFEGGDRVLGHNASIHYYAQHQLDALNPRKSVLEELGAVADVETQPRLRAILGAFLFSGDDVEKPVAVLSGGEKSRLALAKMLLRPANLLCLDEPTNHLDVTAREILEEALEQFEGTMLFISHDRYFINRMATKVVEVRDGRLWEFAGDYDYYLEKSAEGRAPSAESRESWQQAAGRRQQAEDRTEPRAPSAESKKAPAAKPRSKEERRAEAEARQQKSRAIAPLKARLKELESEIATIEARVRNLNDQMANPDLYRDSGKAREVARERKTLEEQAASLYGKWEELALRLESAIAEGGS
jgi:ATP-binding cassette subfamily F protein 3